MLWEVANWIQLVVLRENLDLLAVYFDRSNSGFEAAAVDLVEDFLIGNSDRDWLLLVAIDDCRNQAVAAKFAGGPLTNPAAQIGLEHVSIAHGITFQSYWSVDRSFN